MPDAVSNLVRMTKAAAMVLLLVTAVGARAALAAESTRVYRHVAPDGVVTFSDEPREGAEVIELPSTEPAIEDVERADAAYRQQLEVIEVLERSRHDREDEAARDRELDIALARAEAARAAAEATAALEEERYYYAPWYAPAYPAYGPGHGWPGRPDRPGHGRPDGPGHDGPGRPGSGHSDGRHVSRPLGVKPN